MGWFDKKSWQLRRKIKDLHSELAVAERDGKYVVEQGLFFAELREMGDQTMMVLGAADQLDSSEDEVIRNFFERNGFSVELLRLDKTHKGLAEVEIIPPEELTRRVARGAQEQGYRLVDDSEQERSADPAKKLLTLSSILRAIAVLFAAHVNHIIVSTPIKLNMEGNRLLHWMPRIRDAELEMVDTEVVNICTNPFIEAYDHYYGQFGRISNPDALREIIKNMAASEASREPAAATRETEFSAESLPSGSSAWQRPRPQDSVDTSSDSASISDNPPADRTVDAARTLAHMYQALIGASSERKVRNTEVLLEDISRFFGAKSTCMLTRTSPDKPLHLHANSGSTFCIATDDDGAVTCETEAITSALSSGKPAVSRPQGNGNNTIEAVAVPLKLAGGASAILYILEPSRFSGTPEGSDLNHLLEFSKVFREYPDLLI